MTKVKLEVEVTLDHGDIVFTLESPETGEIRIKRYNQLQVTKRILRSMLKTEAKRYDEEYILVDKEVLK